VPYNKDRGKIHIELDFKISAYANARNYYDRKKQLAQKHEKTIAASTQVIHESCIDTMYSPIEGYTQC